MTTTELGCTIKNDDSGNVLVSFSAPVETLLFSPERATTFAMLVMQHVQKGGVPPIYTTKKEPRG